MVDIETESWTRFVLGAYLDRATGDYFETRDSDELFAFLLERGGEVWAFNGGRYDFLWFLGLVIPQGVRARLSESGARLTRIQLAGLVLRDAAAVVPFMSLAKAARMGGQVKGEPNLPCACAEPCGGYCSIKVGMPEAHYREVSTYLRRDCECTLALMEALLARSESWDLDLRGTIGATAWASAKRSLSLSAPVWPETSSYTECERAKYGGRCQIFRAAAPAFHGYDIHNAYPAALEATALPVGIPSSLCGRRARMAFDGGFEGVYTATALVPDVFIPHLPWRHNQRTCYPVGPVSGTWAGNELRAAVADGTKVTTVHSAVIWPRAEIVYAPFVRRIWELRASFAKDDPWSTWLKTIGNSLTGKLGQAPETSAVTINPDVEKIRCCPADYQCGGWHLRRNQPCCRHYCSGRCRRWTALDRDDRVWSYPVWRLAECSYVHHNVYLTAACRVELRRQLASVVDGKDALGCDTDGIKVVEPRTRRLGDDLGEWGYEGAYTSWYAVGPKAFAACDSEGKWFGRLKGVSDLDEPTWLAFLRGETVERSRGVKAFRSAVASGEAFQRKRILRTNLADGVHFGDRKLGADGRTYPLTCAQIVKELE